MDDWSRRDLRIVEAIGEFEARSDMATTVSSIATALGLEPRDVRLGLRALREADYVSWAKWIEQRDDAILLTPRLREKGRRAIGRWPRDGFDALVAVLEQRIRNESAPDKRSKLEQLLTDFRSIGRDVAADVIGAVIKGSAGLP